MDAFPLDEVKSLRAALEASEGEVARLHRYIALCTANLPEDVRSAPPFRMPFAGEGEFMTPDSMLSHCYGALLPMFTTKEATVLRQLCKEFKDTVADFPWEDNKTAVLGSVASWRACFPRARWVNVNGHEDLGRRRFPLLDSDFVHFVGLSRLDMSECRSVTDAAFVHLKGIHTLNMARCWQESITDAAFVHLQGIHTLDMSCCDQPTITESGFAYLKGISRLNLGFCTQLTNSIFLHLKGVKCLVLDYSPQLSLADDSLKGMERLFMTDHSLAQVDIAKSLGYPVEFYWRRKWWK